MQVIPANAADPERVPEAYHGRTPHIAVILPSPTYIALLQGQGARSFTFHCLNDSSHVPYINPLAFDADAFVESVLSYCRAQTPKIEGVMAFDCLPTMMASVINQELSLPGPTMRSVFTCCNKWTMRQALPTPHIEVLKVPEEVPTRFPCVLKVSDTQFYVGTRIVLNAEDWAKRWADMHKGILSTGFVQRQQFYYKWADRFGWAAEIGWAAASDVRLVHAESFVENRGEYQAEIVVTQTGTKTMRVHGALDLEPTGGHRSLACLCSVPPPPSACRRSKRHPPAPSLSICSAAPSEPPLSRVAQVRGRWQIRATSSTAPATASQSLRLRAPSPSHRSSLSTSTPSSIRHARSRI